MFIPKSVVDFLLFSKDDLIKTRTERDSFKDQLSKSEIMCDWLRMRVNALEIERSILMEKAYNVTLPAPELTRLPRTPEEMKIDEFSFEGIPFTPEGDRLAEKLGLN